MDHDRKRVAKTKGAGAQGRGGKSMGENPCPPPQFFFVGGGGERTDCPWASIIINKLKTTPTPIKTVRMAQKGEFVCHKSRSSYAIKVGSCTTFSVKVPLFQGIFTPYDPSFYGIFWVGVVRIIFIEEEILAPQNELRCAILTLRLLSTNVLSMASSQER